jgi:hypothetical protein
VTCAAYFVPVGHPLSEEFSRELGNWRGCYFLSVDPARHQTLAEVQGVVAVDCSAYPGSHPIRFEQAAASLPMEPEPPE